MVPPPGTRGPGGPGNQSDSSHSSDPGREKAVRCEASRNLKWSITNTGIHAPVYKLTLPNPDQPGNEQPLFQISKPNPNATFWTMFYFTYAGHLIPPKRIEFGKIQKNASAGNGGGGGTRVSIAGKSTEEKAVWQTLGDGNEDMVEWIVLCAALNLLDEEIIKAAEKSAGPSKGINSGARPVARPGAVPSSRPGHSPSPIQIRPTKGPPPQPFQRPTARPINGSPMGQGSQMYPRPGAPPMQQGQQNGYQRPMPGPQHQQMPPMQGRASPYQQQQQQPPMQGYPQGQAPLPGYGGRPPPPQQYQQRPPMAMPAPQANGAGQRGYYGGPPNGRQV